MESHILVADFSRSLLGCAASPPPLEIDTVSRVPAAGSSLQSTPLVLPPELVDALQAVLAQVTISEEPQTQQALPSPGSDQQTNTTEQENEQEANNYERVKAYLAQRPKASDSEIAYALLMSRSTANKWRNRVKEACSQDEHYQ